MDTCVVGLGEYIDRKLDELTPDNKRKYKTVADVLKTANFGREKDKRPKPKVKPGAFKPPAFKRVQKKDRPT